VIMRGALEIILQRGVVQQRTHPEQRLLVQEWVRHQTGIMTVRELRLRHEALLCSCSRAGMVGAGSQAYGWGTHTCKFVIKVYTCKIKQLQCV